jgi:hypothetical protein
MLGAGEVKFGRERGVPASQREIDLVKRFDKNLRGYR